MYGLNIDPLNPDGNPSADELAALGVKMARFSYIDLSAGPGLDLERLRFYTQKVEELAAAGIGSLLILTYDTLPGKPAPGAPDEAWNDYLYFYSFRAGQIAQALPWASFQIWNEPDLPPAPGYEPSLREAVYGRMLRWTYDEIKATDPAATVIGAGLASGDPGWWSRVVESQGGWGGLDANAFHPYGQRPSPDWPNPTWGFGYVVDLLNAYRAVWPGPWWISESGCKDLDEAGQAEYLRRMYGTMTGQASWVFWFCYADGMVSPYGLRDAAGNQKAAYGAYQAVSGADA